MKIRYHILTLLLACLTAFNTSYAQDTKNAFDYWLESYNKGIDFYNTNDFTNAIPHFTEALRYIDNIDFSTSETTQLYPVQNYYYLGVCYQSLNNDQKAIEFLELALKTLSETDINQEDFMIGIKSDLSFAYLTVDIKKSYDYRKEVVESFEKDGIEDEVYAINLYSLAFLYRNMDFMPSFYFNLKKAEKIFSRLDLTNNDYYAIIAFHLGNYYFEINDFSASSEFFSKAEDRHEFIKDYEPYNKVEVVFLNATALYNSDQFEFSLKKINTIIDDPYLKQKENIAFYTGVIDRKGLALMKLQRYEEAKLLYQNFEGYLKDKFGENTEIFAKHSANYGQILIDLDDFTNAEIPLKKAYDIYNALNLKETDHYLLLLNSLGLLNFSLGNYDISESYFSEALDQINKVDTAYPELNKINILNNMAVLYQTSGEYDKAAPIYDTILEKKKAILGENNSDYAMSLMNYGNFLSETGKYKQAETIYLKALNVFKNTVGKTDIMYAKQLVNLGQFYFVSNQYKNSLDVFNEALEIYDKNNLSNSYIAGLALTGKGLTLQNLGELGKALEIQLKAQTILRNELGENHKEYGKVTQNLGGTYYLIGQIEKAVEQYQKAYDAYENSIKQGNYLFGLLLASIADALVVLDKIPDALNYYDIAAQNFKVNFGETSFYYATALLSKGIALSLSGDYNEALKIFNEVEPIIKSTSDKKSTIQYLFYFHLAMTYDLIGDTSATLSSNLEFNNSYKEALKDIFTYRSEKEKKYFLNSSRLMLSWISNSVFEEKYQIQGLIETGLNNELILKGLLLNTTKDVLTNLSKNTDQEVVEKIELYRILRKEEENLLNSQNQKTPQSIQDLKNRINDLETELVRLYNESPEFKTTSIEKDWSKIKEQLKTDEIALEFSIYNLRQNSTIVTDKAYGVYIIRKDWEQPQAIYLFEESELKTLLKNKSPNSLYKTRGSRAKSTNNIKGLYELIWKPIEPYLNGIETVYFSPTGLLNQIPFAALDIEGKTILANQYNLVQLSSSYMLTEKANEPVTNNSLFMGGISYEYQTTTTEIKSKDKDKYISTLKEVSGTRSMDSKWNYLPGTLEEINAIGKLYHTDGKSFSTLVGSEATEAAFKALNGNSPNVIHLSTHGFFFENPKVNTSSTTKLSQTNVYRTSADPLLRSGLILSGANYAWLNGNNPYEDEDGILTALEISNLDLSNTDLVVLSACETGLGDIDGSEGVYGLQRAFKMAGVDLIMMSLWEVPDKETSEFMTLFYTNWLNGQEIRTAFRNTQITMSNTYKDNPEKWAAFVLFE